MKYRDGNKIKYECDNCSCDCEPSELYIHHGEHLCENCILGLYDTVEDIEDMMEAEYA